MRLSLPVASILFLLAAALAPCSCAQTAPSAAVASQPLSAASQATAAAAPVRVAIYDDRGSPRTPADFQRVFGGDPAHFALTFVTAEQIRAGVLKNFDVLVQGGGGAHAQSAQLQSGGLDAIRAFVKQGGGYLGICAGAYLASSASPFYLGILNARVVDSAHWARGRGDVELGFTPIGQAEIGEPNAKATVMYHQGPLLAPGDQSDLAPYTEVARFDTEVAQKGAPHGVMQGTTALASGTYGSGRVFVVSPHPEQTQGQEGIVRGALLWVAGRRQ